MRRLPSFRMVLVVAALAGVSGCASWIKTLRENPIAGVQQGAIYVQSALQAAQMAFGIWASANPEASAGFRTQFETIAGRAQQGITVALDGLRIAAIAGGPSPDPDRLLAEARGALGDIAALFRQLPTTPGRAPDPSMARALVAIEAAQRPVRF